MLHPTNPVFPPPAATPEPKSRKKLIFSLVFLGFALFLFMVLQSKRLPSVHLSMSEFVRQMENGNVADIAVSPDILRGQLRKPVPSPQHGDMTAFSVELAPGLGLNWNFIQYLLAARGNPQLYFDSEQNLLVSLLLPLVPWILIFTFIWLFTFRKLRGTGQLPAPTPIYIVPNPIAPQPQ